MYCVWFHMCCHSVHSIKWSGAAGEFSIEDLVQHILERQRAKPQPRTHTCLCNTDQGNLLTRVTFLSDLTVTSPGVELCVSLVSSGMNIPHRCNNTKHRIISPKLPSSSCTPPPSELGEAGSDGTAGDAQLPHLQPQSSPASSPHPPM